MLAHRITAVARSARPDLRIVVRTRHESGADELRHAGADEVVTEELESSLRMVRLLLAAYGRPEQEIEERLAALRAAGDARMPSFFRRAPATVDTSRTVELEPRVDASRCSHLGQIQAVRPSAAGCEECLREGHGWVHLRICMTCGHVGCCDDSEGRHATLHFQQTGHPIMRSLEPAESWGWCFEDDVEL